MLVDELHRSPLPPGRNGKSGGLLQRFAELLSASHGFIFVVDLLRTRTPEQFAAKRHQNVFQAYADQVEPIMTSMLLASRLNANLAGKPIFFIFGKRDLHRLTPEEMAPTSSARWPSPSSNCEASS